RCLDLPHDRFCGSRVAAVPGQAAARIVDHDLRALRREQLRVGAAQSAAGTGHDGHTIVESQFRHSSSEHQAVQITLLAPLFQQITEGVETGAIWLAEVRPDSLSAAPAL